MMLHESVTWAEVLAALIVIVCVLVGRRAAPRDTANTTLQRDALQTIRS